MDKQDGETWVDAQVRKIEDTMKRQHTATFRLGVNGVNFNTTEERELAFSLVGDRLRALGYHVQQNGPALQVGRP